MKMISRRCVLVNRMPQPMELFAASQAAERLGRSDRLMDVILDRENLIRAWERVCRNKGAPGVDGMKVEQLLDYLRSHGPIIKQELLNSTYKPQPVRRKEISKQEGGVRLLGIPTVLDRFIQQAISQVLGRIWEPFFSEYSYGFRPCITAHQAVMQGKRYMVEGYTYVVDMDLSKFFDRVHHDRLMARLADRVEDKRVLKLIRGYLRCGVMIDGVSVHTEEGTPQGGPLSPLLSNIVLDELDKELEKRGHRFVRYADDFMIYCRSQKAAERVKRSITKYLNTKLKLKVNEDKSAVSRPWLCKFLGFTYFQMFGQSKVRIHAKSLKRFKDKVRELTSRSCGKSLKQVIKDLNQYTTGWWGYFRLTEAKSFLKGLKIWIIRRLRSLVWKQWKNPKTKVKNLKKLGIGHEDAMLCGNARKKYWHMSKIKWVAIAMPERFFTDRATVIKVKRFNRDQSNFFL
jgi:group II intron reverse transcriptase/maturase